MSQPLTLFDKIWAQHEILKAENGLSLLWVDRHYIHEGSFQGFDKVEARREKVARPDLTFAIADHYVPTHGRDRPIADPSLARMVTQLVANTGKHGVMLMGLALTWWARIHLGGLWSSAITRKEKHRLIEVGPYAFVRHPIYTGLIVALLSTAAIEATQVALLGALLIALGLWVKARAEECSQSGFASRPFRVVLANLSRSSRNHLCECWRAS